MAVFTDTVTIYNKVSDTEWKRTVVEGVQWSDKKERKNADGVLSIVSYASITFPEGTYEGLILNATNEEDCIVFGNVGDVVDGSKGKRISDLVKKYPQSGLIKSVNGNANRQFLKNIKVVVS
ncbi:MAG: hypothetical protein E7293_03380 [Lachnospiraceae bacterium]|nr:hypothetical protein [Lachnospiraceae bacterium]